MKSGTKKIKPANKLAGEALRVLRKSVGLTQAQLAERLVTVSPERSADSTAISKFETGRRPMLWEVIVELCEVMDATPLDDFLTEYEAARRRADRTPFPAEVPAPLDSQG